MLSVGAGGLRIVLCFRTPNLSHMQLSLQQQTLQAVFSFFHFSFSRESVCPKYSQRSEYQIQRYWLNSGGLAQKSKILNGWRISGTQLFYNLQHIPPCFMSES